MRQIRRCLKTGCPLASERFVSKLEAALGQGLRPRPVGRLRTMMTEKEAQRNKDVKIR